MSTLPQITQKWSRIKQIDFHQKYFYIVSLCQNNENPLNFSFREVKKNLNSFFYELCDKRVRFIEYWRFFKFNFRMA